MNAEVTPLSRRIAGEVADELSRRRNDDGSDRSTLLTAADEGAYARKLIAAGLEAEARRRLREGLEPLDPHSEEDVAREAYARLFGLGRLQRYLEDPRITDVHVQGHDVVWVKHDDGTQERGEWVADSDDELVELLRTAAARLGRTERRFDAANPELNLQLPDGSRLFAIMEVSARPSITIRKHQFELAFLDDLSARGTLDERLKAFLRAAVLARKSIVIAGGVGCGKTTLMRALINEIPAQERLVTIEDALELGIDRLPDLHPNVVTLEAREPNIEGQGAISLEQLVRMGLRMDPDRVFVGEVRGSEVLPMLLAMSQGQDGSMCTIHANSARGVFRRLQMYAMLPPHRLTPEDTALLAANAIDFVVHLDQHRDRYGGVERYVTSVLEVRDTAGAEVVANEVFRRGPDGRAVAAGALHEETLVALEQVGFDRTLLTAAGGLGPWS
ncbi:MAG: Flp pilus assembly complex ATPase component TadA [Actinomycetota bacterium]|nr:Flp pilus assembly complex ATPase component TadA [Actinomycetota bacterium]